MLEKLRTKAALPDCDFANIKQWKVSAEENVFEALLSKGGRREEGGGRREKGGGRREEGKGRREERVQGGRKERREEGRKN